MKRSRIRPVSKKRAVQLKEYAKLRKEFLEANPKCQFLGCPGLDTQVHHANHREGSRLLDQRFWRSLCAFCHSWLHDHPKAARKLGLLKLLIFFLCFSTATTYADLGYADNDGNLLPLGTGNTLSGDLVRGAIRFEPGKSSVTDCELFSPAQTSSTERGDASLRTQNLTTSSAASNVQPADAAKLPSCFLNHTMDILHEQTVIALGGGIKLQTDNASREQSRSKDVAPLTPRANGRTEYRGTNRAGSEGSASPTQNFACPQSAPLPVALSEQEIFETPGEIFARVELEYAPWYPVPDYL